jgi:hypothetical protein
MTIADYPGTHPRSAIPWLSLSLLLLLYSGSFLILGSSLRIQYGFPLDDSYIHQTVARNFAHYDVLGFIPGKASSGATSLIWACLQASNYKFLHIDPVKFNFFFSWIMLGLIGPMLFILSRRDGMSVPLSFVLAASPALCGNFVWLGLIGMEHLLFIVLVLISISGSNSARIAAGTPSWLAWEQACWRLHGLKPWYLGHFWLSSPGRLNARCLKSLPLSPSGLSSSSSCSGPTSTHRIRSCRRR